jgi:hypothetical protein
LIQWPPLAVWPEAPATWRNVDRHPDIQARRSARAVYERLDSIDPATIRAMQKDGDRPPWLRFAAAGQELFDAWRVDLERRIRGDGIHPAMESHLAQYRSLVPSLALLCHLVDAPDGGTVGLASVQRALAWSEYLETHARRIFAFAPASDLAPQSSWISASEICRSCLRPVTWLPTMQIGPDRRCHDGCPTGGHWSSPATATCGSRTRLSGDTKK